MLTPAAMRYIPNLLTAARIVLTPAVLLLLTVPSLAGQTAAVVLFVAASVSDYYDGALARRIGARSRLGQFLDPLADKILVLGVFAMLAVLEPDIVPWWAVAVIALRDLVVTGVRTWAESHGRTLRTFWMAKLKTLVQLSFLFWMLVLRAASHLPLPIRHGAEWLLDGSIAAYGFLLVVVAFTVGTGVLYIVQPQEDVLDA
jgi:CDP-diacylglycerol--glycerol-3-phosphate 3-phosphatidyltransferase